MPSGEELEERAGAAKSVASHSDERTVINTMRHQYRVLSEEEKAHMLMIKDCGAGFLLLIDKLGSKREYSIAKTKIEEAVMWAVKGITG